MYNSSNTSQTTQAGPYNDKQLCDMALNYYDKKTGYRPPIAEVDSTNGDIVTIHLYEKKTAIQQLVHGMILIEIPVKVLIQLLMKKLI